MTTYRDVILQVVQLIDSELLVKSEIPPLIKLMMKPKLIDEEMGSLGKVTTIYQDSISDIAEKTAFRKAVDVPSNLSKTLPKLTADAFSSETFYDHSSTLLNNGTIRGTLQIPGYTGHIPVNKRNYKKVEHSFGLIPRPVYNNLLLSTHHVGCKAGYTGKIIPFEIDLLMKWCLNI